MAATITRTLNKRVLLAATSLAVLAAKTVTALTRSGTTATGTATSHGFSVGDWVIVAGSNLPQYNGPFQVVTAADANTFTYTMESDPGATSAGTVTAQKGVGPTNLWGDGTTPTGSPASVGALPTATAGEAVGRITNAATGPTVAATMGVYASDTGATGTWRLVRALAGNTANAADATPRCPLPPVKFVLVVFWGNTGQAVIVEAHGNEETSFIST